MHKRVLVWLAGMSLSFATCKAGSAAVTIASVDLGSSASSSPLSAVAQQPGTIASGGSATYQVTVHSSGPGKLTARLRVSGLPAGVNGSFSPSVVRFDSNSTSSQSSILTVTTSKTLAAGTYNFVVTASHGGKNDSQSAIGQLVVGVSSLSIKILAVGAAQLTCTGVPDQTYVLQASSNLASPSSWTNIATNKMDSTGVFVWLETDATQYPCRFYRTARQ